MSHNNFCIRLSVHDKFISSSRCMATDEMLTSSPGGPSTMISRHPDAWHTSKYNTNILQYLNIHTVAYLINLWRESPAPFSEHRSGCPTALSLGLSCGLCRQATTKRKTYQSLTNLVSVSGTTWSLPARYLNSTQKSCKASDHLINFALFGAVSVR